jgi:hypothetical protein
MADYAISNVPRRVVYAASGTGPYAFTFEILAAGDIAVYKGDTLLTLTTDYTVTINSNGTGSVTLVVTAGTSNITIVGSKTIARTTDFTTGGDFFANTLNDELDAQTIFIQQVAETAERGLKAPVTDPTDINMTLPRKADRAGKYLAFDANGNPAPGDTAVEVAAVFAIREEIEAVAAIDTEVVAVAGNSTNVNLVAGSISNVNSVGTNIANVNATATNIANVNAVGADLLEPVSEINTVAVDIANVNSVGNNISNVNSVAGNATNINAVAGNATNINTVAGNNANVTTVAGISANVTTVAGISANVTSVAGNATNINAVAGNATNINAVNANSTNINSVAGNSTNINTVAGISANVTTVATNNANVTTVAGSIANVNTVATDIADVTIVADNIANINAAAAEIPNLAAKVSKTSDTGSAVIPSGTTAQRDGSPVDGYFRYNSDLDSFEGYVDGAWGGVGGAQAGGVIYENGTTIGTSYTMGSGKNGLSVGPITVSSGATLTIPSGQRYVIL